jgi:hypothetical protein
MWGTTVFPPGVSNRQKNEREEENTKNSLFLPPLDFPSLGISSIRHGSIFVLLFCARMGTPEIEELPTLCLTRIINLEQMAFVLSLSFGPL